MKICLWCKYGSEKADKMVMDKPTLMDCRKCPKCRRTCVSSSHLEEEN